MDELVHYLRYDLPLWYVLIPLAVVLTYFYLTRDFAMFKKYGIKGPKPYPLFGSAFPLLRKGLKYDMELYKEYKKHRVCAVFEFGTPGLMLMDPKLVKEVLVKEFSNFTNRKEIRATAPPFNRAVVSIRDGHWKMVRSHLSPTFSGSKMKNMTPLIQNCAKSLTNVLLKHAEDDSSFDVKNVFQSYTLDIIASTMFGMDVDSLNNPDHPFVEKATGLIAFRSLRVKIMIFLMITFPKVLNLLTKLGFSNAGVSTDILDYFAKHLENALDERRKDNSGAYHDFLAHMIDVEVSDDKIDSVSSNGMKWSSQGLTRDDIISQMMIFFIAGYETTSSTMLFIAYHLAKYPDLQEKVIHEVDEILQGEEPGYENVKKLQYLDMFISENERMYPIAARIVREAAQDIEIDGVVIPKGVAVWISPPCFQHDPEYWREPEKFDPERFSPEQTAKRDPNVFLPFGIGPRSCVGLRLAQLELKIGVARVLQKCRFAMAEDTPVDLKLHKWRVAPETPLKLKVKARE